MKNFVSRHVTAVILVFVVLFFAVCALSAYVCIDIREDEKSANSAEYMRETVYKTEVRRLCAALAEENRMSAYHFAVNAADNAASAGYGNDAYFFRKISSGIEDGILNMTEIANAVSEYIETGVITNDFSALYFEAEATDEIEAEIEPSSVSRFREWAAGVCAAEVIGRNDVLHPISRSADGEFVFTCKNAYVVIDARSGFPVEVGISLMRGEKEYLDEESCMNIANDFLREFFPSDIYRTAVLMSSSPNDTAGTFEFVYVSGERTVKMSVRRDIGRVVGLVGR